MNECKNCNEPVHGKYCSNCGEPYRLKRIDSHYIMHEIGEVLHIKKGFLYTIKKLLTTPGQSIQYFITENRSRLMKPITFLIITSLIYTLVRYFFHFQDYYIEIEVDTSDSQAVRLIREWIQKNYGYLNIIIGIFIALWTKLFFRKFHYNFFEIFILLCFIIGINMLMFSVFDIFSGLTHLNIVNVSRTIALIYYTWAIGQFFDKKKIMSYIKAFSSYASGLITFSCFAILILLLTDFITKH